MPNNQSKKKHRRKSHADKNINGDRLSLADSLLNLTVTCDVGDIINDEKPYRVEHSEIYGRYLVANRDLKKGEKLIEQLPLAVGPCAESLPVCLGCYAELTITSRSYRCPDCDWPLCDRTCPGIHKPSGHTKWECLSFKEHKLAEFLKKTDEKDINIRFIFEAILTVRCLLLKQADKELWRKINEMESHNKIRKNLPSLWNRNQELIVDRIRKQWGYNEFSEDEVHNICGVLEVNSFEVGQNGCRARALFPEAYLISHDCCPNTTHTDNPISHQLTVRTTVPLKKDKMITLSYSYILQGTLKRREHLHECKFFWCSCDRCRDPTELGTNSSTLLCPKCTNGHILTTNSLNQDAEWKCRNCSYTILGKSILVLLDRLYDELDSLDVNSIDDYEDYLKRYCNVLHKNHYLMLSAKHSLCQLYGRSDGYIINELNLRQLKSKEDYCRDLLEVVDFLEPGNSRLRGIISYELHAPIMIRITREFESKKITSKELKKHLREIVNLLQESNEILIVEPDQSPEKNIALAAADALKKIGNV